MINTYVAIDLETTGLNPAEDRIIEIGAVKVIDGEIKDKVSTFINPMKTIEPRVTELTGITQSMVSTAPCIDDVLGEIIEFTEGYVLLGHNILFDYSFLNRAAVNAGRTFERDGIDTLKIARRLLPDIESRGLEYLCGYFSIDPGNSHRALDDALSAMKLYGKLYELNGDDEGFWHAVKLEYKIKKQSPITPRQIQYLAALVEKHKIVLGVEIESLTKNEASRHIDKILSTYGR